ncbi:1-hydroxycarotenoid 3,4-desaturase CrtD [Jannaschia sp. M317]|uniref:1-hydroxycarotenoid 3,4-desaturase CrtD n=1 Tax=Jannaschia sp. M317 TaxID=2867011 RepID=UPI0021A80BE1|nr:1-hydroxycarotenoid 3,4-desaturase CrtD [Jannaschia sp. M317]
MSERVVIIGAGIGGLAAALRLAQDGCDVTVLDRAAGPGGKMRTLPSIAGPVDAGPTVLTLRPVFEELFDYCGETLTDHVTLTPLTVLARHHWEDSGPLDLHADPNESEAAIRAFAGPDSAREFSVFHRDTARLFETFEGPMMQSAAPRLSGMTKLVLRNPGLISALRPGLTMARELARRFRDPRLRQLFGRYATYVGGDPLTAPALLSLIWQAEARGVWTVAGGMHRLARALQHLAEDRGARFRFDADVTAIEVRDGRACAVATADDRLACDAVLFNGDPRALDRCLSGPAPMPARSVTPRSLSACVWSFAARPTGPALAHHNVYFARHPNSEFPDIAASRLPGDPTLYVCAQDAAETGAGPGRFEIIMNAPPRAGTRPQPEEQEICRKITFTRLARMGLTFDQVPGPEALTMPEQFNALFPGSDGSLYGRSPKGLMAAFDRPRARTSLPGLYLAGGGVHPGAGVPMAATSGRLAAEAICADLASTSRFRRTATPGGTSTASAPAARAPSLSSPSSAPSSRPGIAGAGGKSRRITSASTS